MVNMPTRIPDCESHSPAVWNLFISSDTCVCSTMGFPPLGNSDHVVVSVSIDFPSNSQPCFIAQLMTILVLIGMVFVIILEILHGRISLSLLLLLLLVNFVGRLKLELLYISLIENIRSSLTYLHCFQLLVLLPQFLEMIFVIFTKRINLLILK